MTAPTVDRSELNADPTPPTTDLAPDEASPPPRRPGQRVRVDVEDPTAPDGFVTYEIQVTNRERLHYEKTAATHKDWPRASEGGNSHAMTFVTWSAAKRAGRTALTYEKWADALLEWDVLGPDVPADPTR
jgi:hypothetical protein